MQRDTHCTRSTFPAKVCTPEREIGPKLIVITDSTATYRIEGSPFFLALAGSIVSLGESQYFRSDEGKIF